MQKLPRLTVTILLVAMAFGALQLRNVATGWQDAAGGSKGPSAADTAAINPEPDAEATALVRAAREQLSKWQSIQANVVQRVDVGDRKFTASGRFLAGEFPRTRLEYEVTIGNTVGTLLEVCDGQVLHIERRIADADQTPSKTVAPVADPLTETKDESKPTIEAVRRDVQRILRATTSTEGAAMSLHAADIGLG
jgi:hypothetical protein